MDDGQLHKDGGDVKAVWQRLREREITEWRGISAFVFALTGPAAADYIQIALGREIEWRVGPIVNPDYCPRSEEELLDPSWPRQDPLPDWFDYLPRELRFFQDWMDSSAAAHRVFANWRWIFVITPVRAKVGCIPGPCSHKSGSCQCCPRTTLRTAS